MEVGGGGLKPRLREDNTSQRQAGRGQLRARPRKTLRMELVRLVAEERESPARPEN